MKFSICLIALLLVIDVSQGLYEDQIGLLDWRKQFIGQPSHIHFDGTSRRLLLGTPTGVVAAVNAANGNLDWRHTFSTNVFPVDFMASSNSLLVTVTRSASHVQAWDTTTGLSVWENIIPAAIDTDSLPTDSLPTDSLSTDILPDHPKGVDVLFGHDHVIILTHNLVQLRKRDTGSVSWEKALPTTHSCISLVAMDDQSAVGVECGSSSEWAVYVFMLSSGALKSSIKTPPILGEGTLACQVLASAHLICLTPSHVLTMALASKLTAHTWEKLATGGYTFAAISSSIRSRPVVILQATESTPFLAVTSDQPTVVVPLPVVSSDALFSVSGSEKQYVLAVAVPAATHSIQFLFWNLDRLTQSTITLMRTGLYAIGEEHGRPVKFIFRLLGGTKMDVAMVMADTAVIMVAMDTALATGGMTVWTREEALSTVTSTTFVDLPGAGVHAYEALIGDKSTLELFFTRIGNQFSSLKGLFGSPLDGIIGPNLGLVRDDFGLHKIIVVSTLPGKLFALDSNTGNIVWSTYLNSGPASLSPIFSIRSAAHEHGVSVVFGKSREGSSAYAYQFNPLTGEKLSLTQLSFAVKMVVYSPVVIEASQTRVLLLLDDSFSIRPFPDTPEAIAALKLYARPIIMHTLDRTSGLLQGFRYNSLGATQHIYTLSFSTATESIVAVASRDQFERVHAVGDPFNDKTVHHKYLNPNLLIVATLTKVAIKGSATLTVYIVDTILGVVVYKQFLENAAGPVHLVHSENWAAIHYRNKKAKRNEIAMLEMFEPGSPPESGFSSISASYPVVIQQSYILPVSVSSMAVTMTEHGITNKMLLFGLTNGQVMGIHKKILDARRPRNAKVTKHIEGLIPYHPMAPFMNHQQVLNYNQTLERVSGISVTPTALESTCLVFSSGLDIFLTHSAPSGKFDQLNDDFNFAMLLITLVGLTVAVVTLHYLASGAALTALWS